ncbi:MAG: bifunctional (p)ppGpp synthetase/guanosine-3',5'-bis(diphosphate) 3'-pyrophosphohydrolase [Bacilli bacterium]|nr:bifunctional (p)ppGpp synthetase/guanosine-3',5'-bis(diphosphate) 3'-pyrophosphohydrolase [Bacilli bacterium]
MKTISKKELEEIGKKIDVSKYSHIIIYQNETNGTYFIKFILPTENVDSIKKSIENNGICGMFAIKELYDCPLLESKEQEEIKLNTSERVWDAISYATKMHQFQYRHDGSNYINHPLRVANLVKKFKISSNIEDLYIAAILHDIIEDTEGTYYDIIKKYGPQVASIVLELTNNDDLKKEVGKTKYLELKMKNMSSWALVIKLCDRLDNITDVISSTETFRNKYVRETIEIINYILENRNLTQTHLNIIEAILERINFLINTYKYYEYNALVVNTRQNVKRKRKTPSSCNKK